MGVLLKMSDKQYGICIFSKYKILARNHVFLTSKKEQRGFALIKVKIEGDRYYFHSIPPKFRLQNFSIS